MSFPSHPIWPTTGQPTPDLQQFGVWVSKDNPKHRVMYWRNDSVNKGWYISPPMWFASFADYDVSGIYHLADGQKLHEGWYVVNHNDGRSEKPIEVFSPEAFKASFRAG